MKLDRKNHIFSWIYIFHNFIHVDFNFPIIIVSFLAIVIDGSHFFLNLSLTLANFFLEKNEEDFSTNVFVKYWSWWSTDHHSLVLTTMFTQNDHRPRRLAGNCSINFVRNISEAKSRILFVSWTFFQVDFFTSQQFLTQFQWVNMCALEKKWEMEDFKTLQWNNLDLFTGITRFPFALHNLSFCLLFDEVETLSG